MYELYAQAKACATPEAWLADSGAFPATTRGYFGHPRSGAGTAPRAVRKADSPRANGDTRRHADASAQARPFRNVSDSRAARAPEKASASNNRAACPQ